MLLLAGCSDGSPLTPRPPAPVPDDAVAVLQCTGQVQPASVRCEPAGPATGGALGNWIIGGQNQNVRLTSTGTAYDSAAAVFSTNVTVQNLLVMRMGTSDGPTVSGIRVFFHTLPVTTAGSGSVSVRNADGEGIFTNVAQPYFEWPEVVAYNATSSARRWEFDVPPTVVNFTFSVYVHTALLPVVVFDRMVSGNRDIWRVALDGSDLVRITTDPGDDRNPNVVRGRIVFTSYRAGNGELYSVPLTGGTQTRLTTTTGASELDPAQSPDGTRIAYSTDASGIHKVWRANADGSAGARVTSVVAGFDGGPESGPSWHPGGERLAFTSTGGGTADIYEQVIGGGATLLVGGSSAEVEPEWNRDGSLLAFASTRDGNAEVYVLNPLTSVITRLTNRSGSDASPTWTLDGRLVYVAFFGSNVNELRWLDPAAASPTPVTIPIGTGDFQRPSAVGF